MRDIRTVLEPVRRECHIQFFVEADPNLDAHWAYVEPFVLDGVFFETEEEARNYKDLNEKYTAAILTVREKVTPI